MVNSADILDKNKSPGIVQVRGAAVEVLVQTLMPLSADRVRYPLTNTFMHGCCLPSIINDLQLGGGGGKGSPLSRHANPIR